MLLRKLVFAAFAAMPFACSAEKSLPAEAAFAPGFEGLEGGHFSRERCIEFDGYSVNLLEKESFQVLEIFAQRGCPAPQAIKSERLAMDSQFSGIWNNYAVINSGTDANVHTLRLIPLGKAGKQENFNFVGDPTFDDESIVFWRLIEEEVNPATCSNAKSELDQWQKFGFLVHRAEQYRLNAADFEETALGATKCFAEQ